MACEGRRNATAALAIAVVAAACGGAARSANGVARNAQASVDPSIGNVVRASYAGSDACKSCHAAIHASWSASPMHQMTRLSEHAVVRAPFDGRELHFKNDVARLEQREGKRFVRVNAKLYEVTKIIGGHHREDFAGVEVASPGSAPRSGAGDEEILPVSFLVATGALRYKGYSVMLRERASMRAGPAWSRTCIFCHNTAPHLSSLFRELAGPHAAKPYQGAIVDELLPKERRWRYEVTDAAALDAAIDDELRVLGADSSSASGRAHLAVAVDATRARFDASHLLEIGIGCESCHLGAAAHAHDPRNKPSFVPTAPFLRVAPSPTRAEAINHACARCHQVLFSQYPFTWEAGKRHQNAGGSNINSGEGRDMLLGGCARAMSCASCHDPHAKDGSARLREIDSPAGNAICLGCHQALRGDDALRAHAHHDPRGDAGVCIRCHMPKKNMTLEAGLGRYHRIGSPTDPVRVLGDRPLECALCHADKSVESLAASMERWWKKSYDREALRALYGDLEAPALITTLARGKPHEQAVAIHRVGETRERRAAELVARQLVNPYPLVREYAKNALGAILGAPCVGAIDLGAEADAIEAAARKCLADSNVAVASAPWPKEPPLVSADTGED